jgi:hypothetical protein
MVEDCKHVCLCFFCIWSTRGEGENNYIILYIICYFFVFTIIFFYKKWIYSYHQNVTFRITKIQ